MPVGRSFLMAPTGEPRLERMLVRLAAFLDAAAIERPAKASVRADLIERVGRLRRYATTLTGDPAEAEDLVQSTLLEAWERREHLPRGAALAAWLFAVLRRTYLHERRGCAGRSPDAGGEGAASASGEAHDRRARGPGSA